MKRQIIIPVLFATVSTFTASAQGFNDPRRAKADTCKLSKVEQCKRDSILAERKRQLKVDTIYIDGVTNDTIVGKNGNYMVIGKRNQQIPKRNPVILFSGK